jgi:hypothetical protein
VALALALLCACTPGEPESRLAQLEPGCDLSRLECTGLYGPRGEGWATRTPGPNVEAFTPGLQLWSDGLTKRRFVWLPPGAKVDTRDMDAWRFPVGTRFWKEFSLQGRPVETRFLWKRSERTWLMTTYAWSEDGVRAVRLEKGQAGVAWAGGHDIPGEAACGSCHRGREDRVLGFEALALGVEGAEGLTLQRLVAEGRLTAPPAQWPRLPGDARAQAALGYLHMNCGVSCHNDALTALGRPTRLLLRLSAEGTGRVEETDAWRTAVGQPALFHRPDWEGAGLLRIAPGQGLGSALHFRMRAPDPDVRMPPLGAHRVDGQGLERVQRWIDSLR